MLPIVRKHVDGHEVIASMIIEQAMEPVKPKILHVEKSPGVNYVRFYACLQDFDVFNRNNRKYLFQPMVESWNAPHIQELIHYGDLFGENGHPITTDPIRVVTIDPKLACHRIVGVEFKGKSLYGTIETLNDEQWGKQFMMHILQGCYAAFSLRALAPLTKIDATRCEIRSKCHVVTEDRVILPSHNKAYQQSSKPVEVMTESYHGDDLITATNKILEQYGNRSEENVNINFTVQESAACADIVKYLLEESHNIKDIVDHFDIAYESAWLSSDHKNVILREKPDATGGRRTFTVSMENYVQNEVSNILREW